MFTHRFVKLPIKLYDMEHKELTGMEIIKDTYEMVNPFEIMSYRKSGENNGNCVTITFKNGEHMLIYLNIRDFEMKMNEHFSIKNDMP